MFNELIYNIPKENHSEEFLKKILNEHPEIKFVSPVGIDLSGNDTDAKIPMRIFLDDINGFLTGAIQTDGSSVAFPGIATLNNAKVDMIADTDVNWFIDYNFENIDEETSKPVGTLRIPCFLIHNGKAIDSRHILKSSICNIEKNLMNFYKKYPELLNVYGITLDDIDDIIATAATELEFWVKTPEEKAQIEQLSTSEVLQEQYWNRTKGAVRTALEECLELMDKYGLESEMGHKEVGGVKAKLNESGKLTHIMEQLELDWKYDNALQAADNELFVRILVKETFRRHGLDVNFLAKPVEGVAGSGEHTHLSIALKLKNGKTINLFAPTGKHFLSIYGYASLMGVLKNYEIINPFISSNNDALRRLKPGFEAPICIVTSIGHSVDVPSRNRTILLGVIRDIKNPLATRFELRSPNPHTNTYLALATMFMACNDGITYAINNHKSEDDLLKELSKNPGEIAGYLEKNRAYRSEEDVFEDYSDEERSRLFGKAPATVYENLCALDKYPEKLAVLKEGSVFTDDIINSYKTAISKRWLTEILYRIIPKHSNNIRSYKMLHDINKVHDVDVTRWQEVNNLRQYLMKDSYCKKSLFSRLIDAANEKDYETVSNLQIEMDSKMSLLRKLYINYTRNLLDI
ncbi:glutamine synthetase [Clostridium botulinum]|uniref:Glutamine synthetase n=1 Tax=Clostridium botulinum TaxID=1491 RepID=A0A9Q1UW92_CLOBO|nr:glutamine synthetase [Clostridium botulinum]KEI00579.1 glutamine synthetase [Clostridium botulinum D str. 16868]KEI05839.1 glutamine synthetase [Clostridium botulinum C/D str. Sp77]KLU75461.1 glutamine synthetase [Clostridium botulinum V891]KOA73900.1 glutamine synthetase [Clostridium botulinum]KOA78717.1 glutamine synthetase [Clostridium botulinum]